MSTNPHINPPAIGFSGVRFGYKESSKPLFENLSFVIEEGAYVGLVGGNGAGKTTVLRLLLGLLRPESGEVRLFGTSLAHFSDWASIGYVPQYVFQREREFPATVREIVESGHEEGGSGSLCQFGAAHCEPVDEALKRAEIFHLAKRRIGELSGGERQRVFIARALVSRPKLLVLDEPTANVDEEAQKKFFAFLISLRAEGMTIVLVSHDLDTVFQQVERVLVLEGGMIHSKSLPASHPHHSLDS